MGFAPAVRAYGNPTSFVTEGSACGITTGKARLRREAKRLDFDLNLVIYPYI